MDRKEEVKKELEDISPFLSKLKKENPFKVPTNYFEQLPDQIMEQARLSTEQVPSVAEQAIPTAKQAAAPVSEKISWLDQLIASFAFMFRPQVAFGLLALVSLTWTGIYLLNQSNGGEELVEHTFVEEADAYIAANIDDFDEEWLSGLALSDLEITTSMEGQDLEEDEFLNEILDELEMEDIEDLL